VPDDLWEAIGPLLLGCGSPTTWLLIDGQGTPLVVALSAANSHDSTLLEQAIDAGPGDHRAARATGRTPPAPGQAARRQGL
jgi:hypothetical protein